MKNILLAVVFTLFSAAPDGWAQAGAANVIKNRARSTAGRPAPPKNGVPSRGPASRATPRTLTANPPGSSARPPQRLIESDLSLIRLKRYVSDELRDRLAGHVIDAAQAGVKPNREAVLKLAFDVATAAQQHKYEIGYGERKKLAAALVQAVNAVPGGTPLAAPAIGELDKALQEAGLPKETVAKLVAGMKGLASKPRK